MANEDGQPPGKPSLSSVVEHGVHGVPGVHIVHGAHVVHGLVASTPKYKAESSGKGSPAVCNPFNQES